MSRTFRFVFVALLAAVAPSTGSPNRATMHSPRAFSLLLFALASALLARAGAAATMSLVLDQPQYLPGQTVTLRLIGDSEGAVDVALNARLRFDPAAILGAQAQTFAPPTGGSDRWLQGALQGCIDPGVCYLMNMIQQPALDPPHGKVDPAVEPFTYAVLTGTAGAPGIYALDLEAYTFFGLTKPPDENLLILNLVVVPEPGTAALLVLGLLGLAGSRRRLGYAR